MSNSNMHVSTYPHTSQVANIFTPTKAKLAAALVKTQKEMGDATKGAKNPFFKSNYADLNAIREAVIPAANANGIAVLQPNVTIDGVKYSRTLLIHESGEEMYADTEVVCVKQNDPQAYGSAISYARRYGLQAFFNVGAVDDDGEAAQGRGKAAAKATPAVTKVAESPAAASPAAPSQAIIGTAPVVNPGTETVVAATEAAKKPSTSFRRPKATPAVEAAPAAVADDQDWS